MLMLVADWMQVQHVHVTTGADEGAALASVGALIRRAGEWVWPAHVQVPGTQGHIELNLAAASWQLGKPRALHQPTAQHITSASQPAVDAKRAASAEPAAAAPIKIAKLEEHGRAGIAASAVTQHVPGAGDPHTRDSQCAVTRSRSAMQPAIAEPERAGDEECQDKNGSAELAAAGHLPDSKACKGDQFIHITIRTCTGMAPIEFRVKPYTKMRKV